MVYPRIGNAPSPLIVQVRYDVEHLYGPLCVRIEGPESHQSCFDLIGAGAPLLRQVFQLGTAGEYDVQLWFDGLKAHETVILN